VNTFAQEILYYISLDQTHWLLTLAIVLVIAPFERLIPRLKHKEPRSRGWVILGVAVSAYLLVWIFKSTAYVQAITLFLNFQLFSISKTAFPTAAIYAFSLLLIDLMMFSFHILSHRFSFLWRLHSIHHADEHVDAKTGVLHHPLESIASVLFVLFFCVILGVPVIALVLYAAVATLHNLFTHANIKLPSWFDHIIRWLIVTPDMHRTHHSVVYREGNSNFGQIFSFWDRIFGTYVKHPSSGEEHIVLGLSANEKPSAFTMKSLLLHPFRKKRG